MFSYSQHPGCCLLVEKHKGILQSHAWPLKCSLMLNSPFAATKALLLVPKALALSEQQLIYDSNLNLMWQSSRTTSQPPSLPT